jgi:hypothetical protein
MRGGRPAVARPARRARFPIVDEQGRVVNERVVRTTPAPCMNCRRLAAASLPNCCVECQRSRGAQHTLICERSVELGLR